MSRFFHNEASSEWQTSLREKWTHMRLFFEKIFKSLENFFIAAKDRPNNTKLESDILTSEFVKILEVFARNPNKSFSPQDILSKTHFSMPTVYSILLKMAQREWIRCVTEDHQWQPHVYQLREDALEEALILLDQESVREKFS